jgi:hypothetical protein
VIGEISLETKTSWNLQWKLCWCLKQFLLAITITCYHTTPTRLTNVNHLTSKTNCTSASILWLGEDGKSAMGPYCLLLFSLTAQLPNQDVSGKWPDTFWCCPDTNFFYWVFLCMPKSSITRPKFCVWASSINLFGK